MVALMAGGCDDHLIGDCADPGEQVYTSDWGGVRDLFARECIGCHNGGTAFDLELTLEEEIGDGDPANDSLVVPGNAEFSRLWQALSWTGFARPMPDGAQTPLPDCKIDHVKAWIQAGAPLTP